MLLPALIVIVLFVPVSPPLLHAISGLETSVTGPSLGILRTTRLGTGFMYLCGSKGGSSVMSDAPFKNFSEGRKRVSLRIGER